MQLSKLRIPNLTMKNTIRLLSLIAMSSGLFVIISILSPKAPVRAAFEEFPTGLKRAINFEVGKETLATMTRREQLDQMRDWLLFTVASDAGLTAEEFNQSLFDLPAVRRGYLQATANFEHGESRSCYIGAGQVVALVPAGIEPNERADQIANIADLHRKNTGEKPTSLTVFEYNIAFDDLDDEPSAEITRRETIDASELFTDKHHYYEAGINNLADIERFMGQVDDLVYAHIDGSTLIVGGRKTQGQHYRGIRVEEIAAIWQSEYNLLTRGNPLKTKIDEFEQRWASRAYHTQLEKEQLESEYKIEEAELKKEIARTQKGGAFANGSGFSLDPAYDYVGLKKIFDLKMSPICSQFVGPYKTAEVSRSLADKNIDPLFDMLYEISQTDKRLADGLEQVVTYGFQFQAARYDGDLKGTEAGMVLFYTDLLAKLWALDFLDSAPSFQVDDFHSLPSVVVSPIYQKEIEALSHTRLWFGPQDKGFQVADKGKSLLFAHTATRIYAASANSLQPGKESEPNAQSAAFLGWWDNHYEEVARYEPQYQRLNQIMKWSLLIGWLNQDDRGTLLRPLKDVAVKRDNWFPDWAKQQLDLRFRAWGDNCKEGPRTRNAKFGPQVCFYTRQLAETEAMPRLASRSFSEFGTPGHVIIGGVSLAERTLFRSRTALSAETEISPLLRRSIIKYDMGSIGGELQTVEGAKFGFKALSKESSLMTASAKDGARLRGSFSEMSGTTKIERTVNNRGIGIEVETRANGAEIGRLDITKSGNGFKVGYASREVDAGQNFARVLSRGGEPLELPIITKDPRVSAAIKLQGEDAYAVRLRETDRWFKIAEDKAPSVNLPEGWQSRVAGLDGKRQFKLAWVGENDMPFLVGKDNYVAVSRSANSEGVVTMDVVGTRLPKNAVSYEAEVSGVKIRAMRDPGDGKIYLRSDDLAALQSDPGKLGRLFQANEQPADILTAALRRGDYRNALEDLRRSPLIFKQQLDQHLAQGLEHANHLMAEGKYQQAIKELDDLSAVHGQQPEIIVLKGVAKLSDRSPKVAQAVSETLRDAGAKDTSNFFREVNQRLMRSGHAPDDATVLLVSDGKRVTLHYDLSSPLKGTPASPAELQGQRVIVLVQDSPGLNNLHWNVNVERSVQEAVSLKLGQLQHLGRGDIAEFRPSALYAPEVSAVKSAPQASKIYYHPHFSSGGSSNQNDDDDEKKKKLMADLQQAEVYVLLANAKTANR